MLDDGESGEVVLVQPGERHAGSERAGHAGRRLAQHPIAEIAAEQAVHRMHAVDVYRHDRERAVRAGPAQGIGEPLLEGRAARQPCEGIERHYQL